RQRHHPGVCRWDRSGAAGGRRSRAGAAAARRGGVGSEPSCFFLRPERHAVSQLRTRGCAGDRQAGNAVIAGRAAHLLLKEVAGALHVLVVAPWPLRIERIMEQRGCSRDAAEKSARDSDHARESYTERFYHAHWADPTRYHLTLNTGFLTREQACAIVIDAAQRIR